MTTDSSPKPVGLKWRSNTTFILSTVGIALFTDLFLYGLVVPILPFILTERLHIPQDEVQSWTSVLLASYAGASVLFSLPSGIIADKMPSRQLPFLIGLLALFASTTLLYLGQTIKVLIIARIFQGISAAVVWTIGLALVLDTVGSKRLGVVIGSIFSFVSVGELMAPVLGGIVYRKAGNGAVFGMGFALIAIDFLMRLAVIEKKVAEKFGEIDETEERNEDEEAGEDSPLLASASQKYAEQWIIPEEDAKVVRKFPIFYCFKNPRLLVAQLIYLIQATLLAVFDATIPVQAIELFGFDSLRAGLLFIPLILPYLLLGSIYGKAVDRCGVSGPRIFATIGFTYLALPLVLLRWPHEGGTPEIVKYAVCLALCGIGLATISAPGIVESSHVIEQYHKHNKDFFGPQGPYGQLYAINTLVFSGGLTLGPIIAGTLRNSIGYGNMSAVVAGLCATVGLLSWVYLGGKPSFSRR